MRWRTEIALVIMAWLILLAAAGGAEITLPDKAPEYTLVDVSTPTKGTGFAWFILGPRGMERWVKTAPGGVSIAFTGPPGKYTIMLVVLLEEGGLDQGHATITIGEEEPGPDPPTPGQKWQVVIVHESHDLDNLPRGQQVLLASLKFRERLKAVGHRLIAIVDKDTLDAHSRVPEELAAYLSAASGRPLPQICISPMTGGKVRCFPLPADGDAVLKLLEDPK